MPISGSGRSAEWDVVALRSSSLSEVDPLRDSEILSQWMPKVAASSLLSFLMNEYEYVIGIRSIDHFVRISASTG